MKEYPKKIVPYTEGIKKVQDFNVISVVGEEKFFRDQVRNRIIALDTKCELIKIDCSEKDEDKIFEEIQYRDLFNSKRIFWLTNFTKIKELTFFTKNQFGDIILLDSEKSGKSKAFKELETKTLFIDCSLKPWEKEPFAISAIKGYASKSGYSISEDTANYLFSNIGFDLYKIVSEIQKVILFKNEKSNITKEDIDSVCILNKSYNIFDIVDKIIDNKKKDALILLDKVFFFETSPSILLISLWYNHFESILYAKNNKGNEEQLLSYIKMSPTVIKKKLIPQSNKLSNKKILDTLNFLAELDVKLRKGSFDLKLHLEKFILDF